MRGLVGPEVGLMGDEETCVMNRGVVWGAKVPRRAFLGGGARL